MDNKTKLQQAIELEQAIKAGRGEFVLLKKLDKLEELITNKPKEETKDIPSKEEEIEIELKIV